MLMFPALFPHVLVLRAAHKFPGGDALALPLLLHLITEQIPHLAAVFHRTDVKFRGGMVRGTAMDGAQAEDPLAQALAQGHVQNAIQPNFLFFLVQVP